MTKYFGTDGFRGEAGETLKVEHAFAIGRFLGHYFGKKARGCRVVIGKDTRLSSYMFECALAAGLTASGADAHLLHVTTTPCVSYITRTEGFDCGIMISASHNPYYDNGIKLFNAAGEKMEDDILQKIERYLDGEAGQAPHARRESIGRTVDYLEGRNRYIAYLTSLAIRPFKGKRIGLDCANGSAWQIGKGVFNALGARTYVIGNRPDGTNINAGVGSTHIEHLRQFVLENKLDVGFAFDGDGDRCLAVDESGQIITGDHIMYIYARYMKEREKLENNTLVTTVMANLGLLRALDELDIRYEITAVGDRYVYENMRENNHLLGGEQSGHIIFAKYGTTGDGVLTALKVMQVMLSRGLPLSQLAAPMRVFPQVLKNLEVQDKERVMDDPGVQAAVREVKKRLGNGGRVLLRPSGTEPLLRVMVEAGTQEECEACADIIISALSKVISNSE